jgi:hypothetical protein
VGEVRDIDRSTRVNRERKITLKGDAALPCYRDPTMVRAREKDSQAQIKKHQLPHDRQLATDVRMYGCTVDHF